LTTKYAGKTFGNITGKTPCFMPAQVVVKVDGPQELAVANVACIVVIVDGVA
jgi:hypothetical protein